MITFRDSDFGSIPSNITGHRNKAATKIPVSFGRSYFGWHDVFVLKTRVNNSKLYT